MGTSVTIADQLAALANHHAARRADILQTWRATARHDAVQTTGDSLTRVQFNDHIPAFLDGYERKLRSLPGSVRAADADDDMEREEVKHGKQRWQQGYTLLELMREWGSLHLCLIQEIQHFAMEPAGMTQPALFVAHRELAKLISEGISESANQYARMERDEAAGLAADLEQTLVKLREIEQQRSTLIHQAVHDLRGNVQTVSSAAEVLRSESIGPVDREEFGDLLHESVGSVTGMLTDLLELARLEAGHERRELASFDPAELVTNLCRTLQPVAKTRGLYLQFAGPPLLPMQGDAAKVRRLLQNLLLNALKYTRVGGVTVSWGVEKAKWWVMIKDTGPGLLSGPSAPMAANLKEATVVAHETDARAPVGESSHVLNEATANGPVSPAAPQQAGEGIGLSIVKRLSEILDANLELTSSGEAGTTFRVMIPQQYL